MSTYCESAFYKANFSLGEYTARRGTQVLVSLVTVMLAVQ